MQLSITDEEAEESDEVAYQPEQQSFPNAPPARLIRNSLRIRDMIKFAEISTERLAASTEFYENIKGAFG